MNKEIMLELKSDYVAKYQDGYPLLLKEALVDFEKVTQEGSVLNLFSPKKKFIAKAYHGLQNKGFGWILSRDVNEHIDARYFTTKIKTALKDISLMGYSNNIPNKLTIETIEKALKGVDVEVVDGVKGLFENLDD
jgi:23S rRNA (cytosine1962-C5)-methyltransferase